MTPQRCHVPARLPRAQPRGGTTCVACSVHTPGPLPPTPTHSRTSSPQTASRSPCSSAPRKLLHTKLHPKLRKNSQHSRGSPEAPGSQPQRPDGGWGPDPPRSPRGPGWWLPPPRYPTQEGSGGRWRRAGVLGGAPGLLESAGLWLLLRARDKVAQIGV